LLKKVIKFNPYFRYSAQECINLQVFDDIRDAELEKNFDLKIHLDVDSEDAFDYDTN
jgi:hypothetical protein